MLYFIAAFGIDVHQVEQVAVVEAPSRAEAHHKARHLGAHGHLAIIPVSVSQPEDDAIVTYLRDVVPHNELLPPSLIFEAFRADRGGPYDERVRRTV
jgi:hypothetical protein